jgi:tetratricopeptide (TPR) repeat protein
MIDQIAAAFEQQDYQTASQLLKEWLRQSPQDPWGQFYWGRLQEISGKAKAAEKIYRQLLRTQTNSKLIGQARQGLQRLELVQQEQRQRSLAQATAETSHQEAGFLLLEAVTGEARQAAIQRFSQVMNVDQYSARGVIPSRGWRLYRSGPIGELQFYGKELRQVGIPTFWTSLTDLRKIQVFQVDYFQSFSPQVTVVCRNEAGQVGTLVFNWTEVSQRVEGLLPVFGQVVDLGYRDRLEWKEHVKDYAHFYDLHLPSRGCILRIHDSKYDFHQGIVARQSRDTVRQSWNDLMGHLRQPLFDKPLWSDFTLFAEMASDFATAISRLKSHVHLSRSQNCYLDHAFHLYSGLAFLKN